MYKVSVITPIYNAEKYLPACLDSAVNQTLKEIEIICIDDGSPDNCAQIVGEFAEKHPNIKLIRQENSGPSIARNAGLDIATGEYICFLDSDDCLDPGALERLFRAAAQAQLDILYFNVQTVFENEAVRERNGTERTYHARSNDYSGICTGQTMFARMRKDVKYLAPVWIQLFRRAFLDEHQIRFYPGILHEDNLFTFQCAMLAQRVDYIPDQLYLRRVREASIMTSPKTIRHLEGYLVCYAESLRLLAKLPLQPDAAEFMDHYLHRSLFKNAYNLWKALPEEEKQKPMVFGGAAAAHLLEMIKREDLREEQQSRLVRENKRLKLRLETAEKKLRALEEEKRRRPVQRIKGFFRTVKKRGLLYAVQDTLWKLRRRFFRFMKNHTRGALEAYYTFAEEKGPRFARTEMARIFRDKRQRLQRTPTVKRLMEEGGEQPLVSIILPVYNVEPYLEQAMDSLINQTLKHIEIICVDDGSTDSSLEILRRYAQKDARVRILTQKNQFAGAARNHGLSKAKGEYVIFLDPDDFFELNLAEDAYFAAKTENADILLFSTRYFDNATKKSWDAPWNLDKQYLPKKPVFCWRDCPDTLYQITQPFPWTKLLRRQFLLDTGLQFQTTYNSNDVFFIYSVLAMAKRIATLDKMLVNYRLNISTSLTSTRAKHPLCFYEAYIALRDQLKELGVLEQLRRSYANSALSSCMHNWQNMKDPKAKLLIEHALRTYGFREMGLLDHDVDYFYLPWNYRHMMSILRNEVRSNNQFTN